MTARETMMVDRFTVGLFSLNASGGIAMTTAGVVEQNVNFPVCGHDRSVTREGSIETRARNMPCG